MTWFLSLLVAALSAAAGLVLAAGIASMAVNWYRISSFEGGAGYYVVFLSLAGGVVGAIIGVIVSRMVAAGANPGFFKALGMSLGALLVLAGSIGGIARLRADVAPEADGDGLLLTVEFRWPAADSAGPAALEGVGYTRLSSSSSGVVRKSEEGPLFLDLARKEDGHWIVPGAARIFTTRGDRVLDVGVGETRLGGFLMRSTSEDNTPQATWSEWYPKARPGDAPLGDQFSYRYRVVRSSEPLRTDTIGAYTIETLAGSFSRDSDGALITTGSRFRIAHRGQPMAEFQSAGAVAVIGGSRVALLAQVSDANGEGRCMLLTEQGSNSTADSLGTCYGEISGYPLTADQSVFRAAKQRGGAGGWLDRRTFATPGLYIVNTVVLDSRALTFKALEVDDESRGIGDHPPISLSPDERSIAFVADRSDRGAIIGVHDWKSDTTYTFPLDASRMRFRDRDDIDPQWVAHHFVWSRDGGVDRLKIRDAFTPLPYRGTFVPGRVGAVTQYSLSPAGQALRTALVDVLIAKLGAQRQPDELDGYYVVLKIDGKTVKVTVGGGLSFSMLQGEGDPALMTRLASTLDAALATGKYDALFVADKE